ncbi:geranylgeranyl pyrophosphate synthase/Polyprenyl synthetase [Talaromyces islandicus]|uniref:Geranylgeranyl pyrophosphate synthase/Polyprenyl synthetase n=1 Tax=Talaromyces islandicus TaxID=28573 RepID=A0A0U1LL34_TALIS|nr:geranylgeranyl pyrophosphate synthase/Polyprenyl synthetase [Talaromyces islandicus]
MTTSTGCMALGTKGPGNLQAPKAEAFISTTITTYLAKYGQEGHGIMKQCLGGWLDPLQLEREPEPTSIERSVSSQAVASGAGIFWEVLTFSLGIHLSPKDKKYLQPLLDVASRIVANTNDYFSWKCERDGGGKICNTIKYLIAKEGQSEQQAKETLKEFVLEDEQNYRFLSEQFSRDAPIHIRKYVSMVQLLLGGYHTWCATCDRYKVEETGKDLSIICIGEGNNNASLQYCTNTILDDSALLDPVNYIQSLPSKDMRSKIIDALNIWFQLPEQPLDIIKDTVNDVHNSTLILDDIQDSSALRRGFAATHHVFGSAQCINSATYMIAQAAARLLALHAQFPGIMSVFLEGLKTLALGQSWDLNWRSTGYLPSISEYMSMIDGKTGSMFEMGARIMCGLSSRIVPLAELNELTCLLGRWYQIRDDYQNLQDERYTAQKGFCEDLDEGKLSYPIIVSCNADPKTRRIIMGILRQRQEGTILALGVKLQILNLIRRTGALKQTWEMLRKLEGEVKASLEALETVTGEPNPLFRAVVKLLGGVPKP